MQGVTLKPGATDELRQLHGRLRGVHEFLVEALEALGDARFASAVEALNAVAPWTGALLDATAASLPPVKFLLKLFEGITELSDPNELGELACTLAFQRAVEQAIPEVLGLKPPRSAARRQIGKRLAGSYDFTTFTWEGALRHPFVVDAVAALEEFGSCLGFDGAWSVRLQREVQARFVTNLKGILSHGKTRERFGPFGDRLELGTSDSVLKRALLDHADTQRWQFEERPVLGAEPFPLADVYIQPQCTVLDWELLGKQRQSPSAPELPRVSLYDAVIGTFGDRSYRELLFVQGPAGSGKSSFTLALAASLIRAGMTPLRVELKHLDSRPDLPLLDALARALECSDTARFPDRPRFLAQSSDYERDFIQLFDEEVTFQGLSVCPYVLILDGLDELPLSGNHNYLERLRRLLSDLKETLIRRREPAFPVRVLLAGRPSDFLEQAGVLAPKTRVLSVQPWSPQAFERFIAAIQAAQERSRSERSASGAPARAWRLPPEATLSVLVRRFRAEDQDKLAVLSSPLIAHLCLRLLGERSAQASSVEGEPERGVDELFGETTSLYRNLVDLVITKAGKPSDADFLPHQGAMIAGGDLRRLLHKTAEVMSALGVENVAHEELMLGLDIEEAELEDRLRQLEGKELISRLMISFFFKGGHRSLGCEFSHKTFREYLFAEAIVEALKQYARSTPEAPAERSESEYWKDYDESDPRYGLSRRLAELLGPQWLTSEVIEHLRALICWEVARARKPAAGAGEHEASTGWCSLDEWNRVRDGLADLWDWWGEGVHLRPQPRRRPRSHEHDWSPPYASDVAQQARFHATRDIRPPPIRVITVDSHLGDALCLLNAIVHRVLLNPEAAHAADGSKCPTELRARRYQWVCGQGLRFAPGGVNGAYIRLYAHRICAAGYRPLGPFPRGADFGGAFLHGGGLRGADLCDADLRGADLERADLQGADLRGADLRGADLRQADLSKADLRGAHVRRANLQGARLSGADLSNAYLIGADLLGANLKGATLNDMRLGGNEADCAASPDPE
jgi:uncharacterized protein YjbI with pentapeptide repeats